MPFANYSRGNRASKWGSFSTQQEEEDYAIKPVQRQIENAKLRIQDSGYKPEDTDKRNWFEKGTNLPQGQNWFFDTLELLGRPGQAVMNVIDKGPENIGQSAWRGFSGQDRVRGSQIVEKAGFDGKIEKALLGTTLDIVTDPINLLPAGAAAKGIKTVAKPLGTAAKTSYNALENVAPFIKRAREETVQPIYDRTKDSLGYMFNPQYKQKETLFGEESDFLTNTFRNTENQRRFMQEDFTNRVADVAKTTGLEAGDQVGRVMEQGLKQFDDAGNEIPRVAREMPTDPKINTAAKSLIQSNQEIRELARSNEININELEGYMTHILSREERSRRKNNKFFNIDKGTFRGGQPDKRILNERKLKGSVEDINEELGRNFFEPNAYFASAIGQRRLIDYIQSVGFRKQILNNSDFAQPYVKGMDIPNNAVLIDSNNYKFIKESGDLLEDVATKDIGGQYVVTKATKQLLDRYQRAATDEGARAFLKAFDTAQSFWKRAALFSIPYHLRNDIGAKFNNWVGGMGFADITKYSAQADRVVYNAMIKGKETPLYREYRQQGLGASSQSQVEFARRGEEPEKAIEKIISEKSKDMKGKVIDRLKPWRAFETSRELGDFIDQTNRFAVYKWAREKNGMTPEQAASKVREMQFDYMNMTNFEQSFMTRAMPFYRWMRNNIPYQIKSFINDPKKYANLNKLRLNAQEAVGIDEEIVPDFMKEGFYMPVSGEEGTGKMLGFNLPLGDLTRINNPLKMGIDSTTPLAKLPLELGINRNLFFDKPIEKFEGEEKQFNIPGTDINFGVPSKTAYAIESATGQIGRGFSRYLTREESVDQDTKFRLPSTGISSVLKEFDAKKENYFKLREELRQLQDLINYIEQQEGTRPRGVNEIR